MALLDEVTLVNCYLGQDFEFLKYFLFVFLLFKNLHLHLLSSIGSHPVHVTVPLVTTTLL